MVPHRDAFGYFGERANKTSIFKKAMAQMCQKRKFFGDPNYVSWELTFYAISGYVQSPWIQSEKRPLVAIRIKELKKRYSSFLYRWMCMGPFA